MRFAKNTQHDTSKVLRLPRKMKMDRSKVLCLSRKMQVVFWKPCKSIAHVTQNDFRLFFRHMRMSWSATPATQNEIRTAFETFGNERCCSLPHIDTAPAGENQRIETRHVGASKRAFLARLPPTFRLCSFKIGVFRRVFSWTWKCSTSKSMFRASIFSTCHKMPPLPWNLHVVTTWRSPANAIRKKHATRHVWSAAPATQNDDGCLQSAAPAMKKASHLLKTMRQYAPVTQNDFWHVMKHAGWNGTKCDTCHTKRGYATFETSKSDHFCSTPHIGTAIATSSRTVANGCTRLRRQKQRRANMTQPSEPQSKTRTLPHWFGKKSANHLKMWIYWDHMRYIYIYKYIIWQYIIYIDNYIIYNSYTSK